MVENTNDENTPAGEHDDAAEASTGAETEVFVPEQPQPQAEAAPVAAGTSFRDRVWSFRAMLAVGVAALLIGGAGGAGIVAATSGGDDHRGPRIGRFAEGPGGRGGHGLGHRRNGGGPGFDGGGPGFGGGQQLGPQNGLPGGNQSGNQTGPGTQQAPPAPAPGSNG